MGDNIDIKYASVDIVDSEADTIDTDRSLGGNVSGKMVRYPDAHPKRTPHLCNCIDCTDAIDMSTDEMTAEGRGRQQGLFKIERISALHICERGTRQCLTRHVN